MRGGKRDQHPFPTPELGQGESPFGAELAKTEKTEFAAVGPTEAARDGRARGRRAGGGRGGGRARRSGARTGRPGTNPFRAPVAADPRPLLVVRFRGPRVPPQLDDPARGRNGASYHLPPLRSPFPRGHTPLPPQWPATSGSAGAGVPGTHPRRGSRHRRRRCRRRLPAVPSGL